MSIQDGVVRYTNEIQIKRPILGAKGYALIGVTLLVATTVSFFLATISNTYLQEGLLATTGGVLGTLSILCCIKSLHLLYGVNKASPTKTSLNEKINQAIVAIFCLALSAGALYFCTTITDCTGYAASSALLCGAFSGVSGVMGLILALNLFRKKENL